jgi:hypothetical protein
VDQITGVLVFVAADAPAGSAVLPDEFSQPKAGEHPVHRRRVHAELVSDPVRAPPQIHPQADDPAFATQRCAARAGMRAAGAVFHPGLAVSTVPFRPPLRGTDRDLEAFGGAAVRPAVVDDAPGQRQTALGREKSVKVGHEDLSGDECGL